MQDTEFKIKKYLDNNNRHSPFLSEIVRQAYKDARMQKETPSSKLINSIFIKKA